MERKKGREEKWRGEKGGGEGRRRKKEALGEGRVDFFLYGKPARNISSRNPWSTQTPTRLETEDQKRTSVCGD